MSFLDKIMVKPWEHAGEMDGIHGEFRPLRSTGLTGLLVFLAVISSMFMLFFTSYYTRSQFPDWEVLREPDILWINTAVLVVTSIVLQLATHAARRGAFVTLRYTLIASGVLTVVFVAGQLLAWEQLLGAGFYAIENPANAFFYLLTGLHALHLIGGLGFMVLLGIRLNKPEKRSDLHKGVALCTSYWHYLLLVWLVLFTLLLKT